jgi:hypothetical protein
LWSHRSDNEDIDQVQGVFLQVSAQLVVERVELLEAALLGEELRAELMEEDFLPSFLSPQETKIC